MHTLIYRWTAHALGMPFGGWITVFAAALVCGAAGAYAISRYGRRLSLIDSPNERSSHSRPTPRGGGIGIVAAAVVFNALSGYTALAFSGTAIGALGLADDIRAISCRRRLFIQLAMSAAALWLLKGVSGTILGVLLFIFWTVFIAGTANFYNFLDGINGIAALEGVVGLALIAVFARLVGNQGLTASACVMMMPCLGFLPFNYPQARVFMGDVGSLFLGFTFAVLIEELSVTPGAFLCLIMFLSVYYADALLTLISRFLRGEDLSAAHRSHLYQFLSNELEIPHWKVSLAYATAQAGIGALAIAAYRNGVAFQLLLFCSFSVFSSGVYIMVKNIVPKARSKIELKKDETAAP